MELHEVKALRAFAAKIRIAALDAIHSIGVGHLGGALSVCDVLSVLYGREMKYKVDALGGERNGHPQAHRREEQ